MVFRIGTGVLFILYEGADHFSSLATWIYVTLEIGTHPLIFAMMGWIGRFAELEPGSNNKRLGLALLGVLLATIVSLILTVMGIVTRSFDFTQSDGPDGGVMLVAGVSLVMAALATVIILLIALWAGLVRRKTGSRPLHLILSMLSLWTILLSLCVVYTCMVLFNGRLFGTWDPVNGSLDPLVRMKLLPEYVVVLMMVTSGFWMRKMEKAGKLASNGIEMDGGEPITCCCPHTACSHCGHRPSSHA